MKDNTTKADVIDALDDFEKTFGKEIEAKEKAGLTREQAIAVIKAQAGHDSSQKPAAKPAEKTGK